MGVFIFFNLNVFIYFCEIQSALETLKYVIKKYIDASNTVK